MIRTLTEDVVKSSDIEGEKLDTNRVRSSVARRLGLDVGGRQPADRRVEGVRQAAAVRATRSQRSHREPTRLRHADKAAHGNWRMRGAVAHFPRKQFGWGPPATWQGGVFLFLFILSLSGLTSGEPTAAGIIPVLALIAFVLYVLWQDTET